MAADRANFFIYLQALGSHGLAVDKSSSYSRRTPKIGDLKTAALYYGQTVVGRAARGIGIRRCTCILVANSPKYSVDSG